MARKEDNTARKELHRSAEKTRKILLYAKINIMSGLVHEDPASLASSPFQPMPATNGSANSEGRAGSTAL
jgi:hypothetical protein